MTIPKSPNNSTIHRRGVVAVVVRDERFLVICRSLSVLAPGAFCFAGGGIEPGESEEQALVREVREELGVAIRPVRRVWEYQTRWHVDLAWWLGELEPSAALAPNPAEVAAVHWMTASEILAHLKLLDSNRAFFTALAEGEIDLAGDLAR